MGVLTALPNIGPTLERQLNEVGIGTPEQLREIGSREAWLRIQAIDPSACLHRLSALEGAVRGIRKTALSENIKSDLRTFVRQRKISQ